MEDREYVIKIDEENLRDLYNNRHVSPHIKEAFKNSIPLPKGHVKLGDLNKIKKEMQNYHDDCAKTSKYTRLGFETAIAVVEDAQPIIEADSVDQ